MKRAKEGKYVGQNMVFEKRMDFELRIGITGAWRAFWSLKGVKKEKMNRNNFLLF